MCSEHFDNEDSKFIGSQTRILMDVSCLQFLWSTRGYFKKKYCFVSSMIMLGMATTGQELKFRKKWITARPGKSQEFYFESWKIYTFERSQGKVKFQVIMKLFISSWSSSRWKMLTLSPLIPIMYFGRTVDRFLTTIFLLYNASCSCFCE